MCIVGILLVARAPELLVEHVGLGALGGVGAVEAELSG